MNQAGLLSRRTWKVLNSFALALAFGVPTTLATAAVAPKDNAPGVGQAKCTCSCAGSKTDPFTTNTYNAPGNDTKNCSQLDNHRCAIVQADGTVRNGNTLACTPASSTSPGKIAPVPQPQRK